MLVFTVKVEDAVGLVDDGVPQAFRFQHFYHVVILHQFHGKVPGGGHVVFEDGPIVVLVILFLGIVKRKGSQVSAMGVPDFQTNDRSGGIVFHHHAEVIGEEGLRVEALGQMEYLFGRRQIVYAVQAEKAGLGGLVALSENIPALMEQLDAVGLYVIMLWLRRFIGLITDAQYAVFLHSIDHGGQVLETFRNLFHQDAVFHPDTFLDCAVGRDGGKHPCPEAVRAKVVLVGDMISLRLLILDIDTELIQDGLLVIEECALGQRAAIDIDAAALPGLVKFLERDVTSALNRVDQPHVTGEEIACHSLVGLYVCKDITQLCNILAQDKYSVLLSHCQVFADITPIFAVLKHHATMDALEKITENLPSNIVSLAKEVAKAGIDVGKNVGEFINDFIDTIFDGQGNV